MPQNFPPSDHVGVPTTARFDKWLGKLPGLLSSKATIVIGIALFFYLCVYGAMALVVGWPEVPTQWQLILGNYTNVSSSVGAGIAAGAGLTEIRNQRRHHRLLLTAHLAAAEAHKLAEETHRMVSEIHISNSRRTPRNDKQTR